MAYYEQSRLHTKLRFGVGRPEGPQSGYWTVKGVRRAGDLYIAYSDIRGDMFHISLHDNAEYWQLTVDHRDGRVERMQLSKPPPLRPGLNRAISLVSDPTPIDTPTPKKVHWDVNPALGTSRWFDVLIEEPFNGDHDFWPGKRSMGTELVGRVPLGEENTAVVVSREGVLPPDTIKFEDETLRDRLVEIAEDMEGTAVVCLFFQFEDGAWGARAGRVTQFHLNEAP
jgi:hypothetical protein